MVNVEEADFWDDRFHFRDDGPRFKKMGEPTGSSIFYVQGPSRTIEYPFSDKNINKHQEKVTHSDECRCKKYDFDDDVVMYEHIEQYPQFRCYCEWCLKLLAMDCSLKDVKEEDIDHSLRFQLAGKLIVEKGIDLRI
jgi:hypothetical protein